MADGDNLPAPENPYASPQMDSTLPEEMNIQTEMLLEGDLRAFVGRKADYYLGKWTGKLITSKASAGFNTAAFFLAAFWLPYRKMYLATLIFYAVIMAISIAEDVLFLAILQLDAVPNAWSRLWNIAIAVTCGTLGNRWYLSHATRIVSDIRAVEPRAKVARDEIARRGGTNLLAAFGCFALFVVVMIAAIIALDILLFGL